MSLIYLYNPDRRELPVVFRPLPLFFLADLVLKFGLRATTELRIASQGDSWVPRDLHGCVRAALTYIAIPAIGVTTLKIMVTLAPITIAIDVIVGIASAIYLKYKGYANRDILKLLRFKVVTAPLQHMIFRTSILLINRVTPPVFHIYFLWHFFYPTCERIATAASKIVDSSGHSVFCGKIDFSFNWVTNQLAEQSLFMKAIKEQPNPTIGPQSENNLPDFQSFLGDFLTLASPLKVLQLNENFTSKELKQAYLRFSAVLHPDKFPPDNKKAAGVLFKVLTLAKEELGNQLSKRVVSAEQVAALQLTF